MRSKLTGLIMTLAALGASLRTLPTAIAAPTIIAPPSSQQLSLEIGKGRLIRLDGAAASVFVADPKIADIQVKSPSMIYVVGKSPGETTLFAVDQYNAMLANMAVTVRFDETALRQDLKRLLPGSDIGVSTTNNALVLTGTVSSAAEGESARNIAARFVPEQDHILNNMQIDAPNQINLRVRIAEVSRDIIKQFGFNWGAGGTGPGHFAFGIGTGSGSLTGATPGALTSVAGANNLFASFTTGNIDLNVLMDALDSEGLIKTLAEPNLTAISGSPASFLAGGEFPVPVPQSLGVTTIDYKKFGVSLSFVATIADGGRINLVVKPEVSELSTEGEITLNGVTVPALTTRRTETTVDLASGQSFAIAGLLQNDITQTIQKFPGLGNVPVLGALFRSDSFERKETELVVIVTPYIVRPVSNRRLAIPTDGYVAPTDAARYLEGADYTRQQIVQQPLPGPQQAVQSPAPVAATRSSRGLIGPVGFELQ